VKLPPVWECQSTTPVKAKTSAPAPDLPTSCAALTRRGLVAATHTDTAGTRWRAAADVGAGQGQGSRSAEGRRGNRLGDSVGESTRSVQRRPWGATQQGGRLSSGGVWPRRMRKPCCFKGGRLIAGLVHPQAVDDAHPDIGQGAHRHTMRFALRPFALLLGQRPSCLLRRRCQPNPLQRPTEVRGPFYQQLLGDSGPDYLALEARPSHHRLAQERGLGKRDLFLSVEPCGGFGLSPAVLIEQTSTCSSPQSKGLSQILTYKEVHRIEALKTSRSLKNPCFTVESSRTLVCAF
jgi:hypothetical protein